ncbi:MAG TPA: BON domain-containing protein [Gemmatimonadaceae bacterium]|nr:BON domain-containing protein [Gemmatimonadaceae bacterium]
MSFRYRDDESSTGTTIASVLLGAMAGFAVGMYVAQRVGGFRGLTARLRSKGAAAGTEAEAGDQYDEIEEDGALLDEDGDDIGMTAESDEDAEFNGMDATDDDAAETPLIEERVLEAFNNDPILAERAIDIGTVGDRIIELAGWVDTDDEAEHAMTIARGVPGVDTVINRLLVEDEEQQLLDNVRKGEDGDPALTDARWEGQQVGTGKRRQGNSAEADRHSDPKPDLEERWLSEREAVRHAAEPIDEIAAERRRKSRNKTPRPDRAEPTA